MNSGDKLFGHLFILQRKVNDFGQGTSIPDQAPYPTEQMSVYRKLAIAILFHGLAFAAVAAFGQPRKLLGRVVDEETQKPLKNAAGEQACAAKDGPSYHVQIG
jgi:hypothetical protein